MPRAAPLARSTRSAAFPGWGWLRARALQWILLLIVATPLPAAELTQFEVIRNDEGVFLNYAVDFQLPTGAEEALAKAVPLYFVAEASVFRDRWYWRDKRLNTATRTWRIVYQPLTSTYRVTFGGLSQSYPTRAEALATLRSGLRWRIADAGAYEEGSRHYVDFRFRLDTSQLPRPMQIGIGDQPDWLLDVERVHRFD